MSLHAAVDHANLILQMLLELHNGVVPATFEELEQLPGVGHKTASVIMAEAHGCACTQQCSRPPTEPCLSRLMPALLLSRHDMQQVYTCWHAHSIRQAMCLAMQDSMLSCGHPHLQTGTALGLDQRPDC